MTMDKNRVLVAMLPLFFKIGPCNALSCAKLDNRCSDVALTMPVRLFRPEVFGSGTGTTRKIHLIRGKTSTDDSDSNINKAEATVSIPIIVDDTLSNAVSSLKTSNEITAVTGTVNERLLAELEDARRKEVYGARSSSSSLGKKQRKFGLDSFRTQRKTDAEREAAIEDARDLNGISPVTAFVGAGIALGGGILLWTFTNFMAEYFALRPVENITEVYFLQRVTYVYRNIMIGLVSLCAGFFGVTGFGILLLAIRVSYGVIIGELDPTPTTQQLKSNVKDKEGAIDFQNVWDLMTNKKPGRRR
jgi:Protein of unknown function (DUF3082)